MPIGLDSALRPFVTLALVTLLSSLAPRDGRAAAAPAALPRIAYLSPVPGSRYLTPETGLIVRFASAPQAAAGSTLRFVVTGSASGLHAGRPFFASDGRTLLFRPDAPFARGERVDVSLVAGPGAGEPVTGFAFWIAALAAPRPPSSFESELAEARQWAAAHPAPARARPAAATQVADLPALTPYVYGTTAPGQLFYSPMEFLPPSQSWPMITNDAGSPSFDAQVQDWTLDFKPQPDGHLTYYDYDGAHFLVLDDAYHVVRTIVAGNGYAADGHDLRLLPDGHAFYLIYDPQVVDMSAIVPGGNPAAVVSGLVIQEQDADGNVVFQWRSWDHFQITDATHEDLTAATIDYVHGNALEFDADSNLVLSSRHMDEITKIDRQTGDILWRWGGKHNQFTFLDDTLGFSHQHAIRRIANGHFTLFDNGNFHTPQFSRALEYALDEDSLTARLVWQYRNDPDTYGLAMGYVQRLDNGNTLIGWGTGTPAFTEVDSTNAKVLEMWFPDYMGTYRVYRADWWPRAAVSGPGVPAGTMLALAGPNPCRDVARLTVSLAAPEPVTLKVYDVSGRQVLDVMDGVPRPAGAFPVRLDLSRAGSGVYFCRLVAGARAETRRLLLLH